MLHFFIILGIIIAVLLVLVVLIQNPKGGGIDSSFGAVNQLGSVRKTTDFIEKATWTLGVGLAVVSLVAASFIYSGRTDSGNVGNNGQGGDNTESPI
ncbi:MAG: preprotein translocase subunit SecG [Flavobacteriales bacterium]|nr:preprotein translocase subunit SecG [Flavobacteriales bacterium]